MRKNLFVLSAIMFATAGAAGFAKSDVVKVKLKSDSEASRYESYRAMDGDPQTMWHTKFGAGETPHPHDLTIDLGDRREISGFGYLPRPGGGNGTIKDYEFYVSDDGKKFGKPVAKGRFAKGAGESVVELPKPVRARYVRLRALSEVNGRPWTSVAELRLISKGVRFTATESSAMNVPTRVLEPQTELEMQYDALLRDIQKRARFEDYAPQTYHPASLILDGDRDPVDVALRRTAALLADLKRTTAAQGLAEKESALKKLAAACAKIDPEDADARFGMFEKVCGLRREIAFSNPLLDFDKVLFIKRHRSGFNHMCDQYYGVNMKPGGSIFVLSDPFGEKPEARDILANSRVERGRLEGRSLAGGSFLSPDLSYDGKTILFSYVECQGDTGHLHHTDPSRGHWNEGRAYHLFRVNVDGSGLAQLTDGAWNDFDPCWLPNGRAVFITERRGGYLRCGRVCPTYTLYDMKPDGTDIQCLSPHETNEWHPSVTHDGMIIYTRWDYVDRHGCVAHLPWITTPDGRDSRAVHGNFALREDRPDMEVSVRAIPGSRRFIATASPHHGQAFGSLIMVDPKIEDDDKMAPVSRITPEIAFPESQGGAQVYGTAWPLSEKYYLCVYDSAMRPGAGRQGKTWTPGNYGIYLVDAFGNKELLYRDPEIACLSPMPLRPREMPPVVPEMSERLAENKPKDATLALVNVYDSIKDWPEGTKITALRIFQIIPMSVPSGAPPHEVGLRLPGLEGADSVILARYVLGTVPVEDDGSAHFIVPAMKELFFQALDEEGLAVQSMRSATYLQPGERLVCQGCHEPRHRAPDASLGLAKALKRKPSIPKPDVDGTNPFSYPRLVQPVLDKHCTECHAKDPEKAPDLSGTVVAKGRKKWYASYHSLAPDFGFWQYGDRLRTTPGKFGAKASKLLALLQEGHYDVNLPKEDLHRITLWLDSSSIFYGVYEKEGGEAQLRGEVVWPTLE